MYTRVYVALMVRLGPPQQSVTVGIVWYQRRTLKEVVREQKTAPLSDTAKNPRPQSPCAGAISDDIRKVFFIS